MPEAIKYGISPGFVTDVKNFFADSYKGEAIRPKNINSQVFEWPIGNGDRKQFCILENKDGTFGVLTSYEKEYGGYERTAYVETIFAYATDEENNCIYIFKESDFAREKPIASVIVYADGDFQIKK